MKKDKVTFGMQPVPAGQNRKKSGKTKTVAVVLSIAAAVLVVTAGGLFLWNAGVLAVPGLPQKEPEPTQPFTFEADTKVSGLDISGKTVSQARMFLKLNEAAFVPPKSIEVQIADSVASLTQADFDYTYNIDEVVDRALDSVSIQKLLGILLQLSQKENTNISIISHRGEVENMFKDMPETQMMVVQKQDNISRIVRD